MSMNEQLQNLRSRALDEIASVVGEEELQNLKVKYLGKKGELTSVMKGIGSLSPEERPLFGQVVNSIRDLLEERIESILEVTRNKAKTDKLKGERVDVTLPGRRTAKGTKHPVTLVIEEVSEIFAGLGFQVAEGPEIEQDYYNFEALNFPKDHPARDMQDTFFVENNLLLRTHT